MTIFLFFNLGGHHWKEALLDALLHALLININLTAALELAENAVHERALRGRWLLADRAVLITARRHTGLISPLHKVFAVVAQLLGADLLDTPRQVAGSDAEVGLLFLLVDLHLTFCKAVF